MKPHQEPHPDGTTQGRDPRRMSPEDLAACGIERQSRGEAIRAKCLDCCCGNSHEVRRCGCVDCALWPFRMGSDPWHRREMTEEQLAVAKVRGQELAKHSRYARQPKQDTGAEEMEG